MPVPTSREQHERMVSCYLFARGTLCPLCGRTVETRPEAITRLDNAIAVNRTCECGTKWVEHYVLYDIELLDAEGNAIPSDSLPSEIPKRIPKPRTRNRKENRHHDEL